MFTKLVWAAIGAAAGYFVANYRLQEYYEERLQKASEDAEYFFKEKYKAKYIVPDHEDEGASEMSPEDEEPEEAQKAEDILLSGKATEALVNYRGISTAPSTLAQAMAIEEEAREAEDLSGTANTAPGPRLINRTMFDLNEPGYEQSTVTYFANDSEVADERDVKLSKKMVQKHIGYYNLEQLGDHRTVIYVRNDRYKMDFEINWDSGSYDSIVLGKKG